VSRPRILAGVEDNAFSLAAPLTPRLREAVDVEGKLPRALLALGLPAAGDTVLLGDPGGSQAACLAAAGIALRTEPLNDPFRLDLPDASLDAIVSLWSGFRGVDAAARDEADRVLRPGGRLLVAHDYGRDDVSGLRPKDAPEYTSWSRRDGPFLRDGGFRIHVLHCFWTFATIEDAADALAEAFGERGAAVGAALRRPRMAWNVAIYHRSRPAP
jgi:SAM-dependent methyltransferase